MKKIILLLLVTFSIFSFNTINDASKIIGKWKGEDNLEIGYMIFQEDGFAYFEIQGQIFGGKEFNFGGDKGQMTFEINDTTNPITIDFIVTKLSTGEQNKLLAIAEFIDDNTMNFAIGFDGNRPTDFDNDKSILMHREN